LKLAQCNGPLPWPSASLLGWCQVAKLGCGKASTSIEERTPVKEGAWPSRGEKDMRPDLVIFGTPARDMSNLPAARSVVIPSLICSLKSEMSLSVSTNDILLGVFLGILLDLDLGEAFVRGGERGCTGGRAFVPS